MEVGRKLESLIRSLHTRHGRKKHNLCLCEGLRAARELFAEAPGLVKYALVTPAAQANFSHGLPGEVITLDEAALNKLADTVNPQGIIAVAEIPPPPQEFSRQPFILALDGLGDPGNFGTIARTARSVGLSEIWYTKGSIDPYGDKAIRSGMGAQFALGMRSFDDLSSLRAEAEKQGFKNFYITDPHGGENYFESKGLFEHSVVVIGGEAAGAEMLSGSCHITIPMPGGYESINAAQAATVILFEFVRRSFLPGV